MKRLIQTALLLAAGANISLALPTLQLDASPGVYFQGTESTVTTTNDFTLYALLNSLTPGGTYYIAAALFPAPSNAGGDFGSFVFNGTTVNATADMTWGSPNLMPAHGVYPTWYKEFAFTFSATNKTNNYNVQDVEGEHSGATYSSSGNALFHAFSVDVSGLAADATLVFDLYTYNVTGKGKVKFQKAPFSHNAEATPIPQVPDGGSTLALAGFAIVLVWMRKFL